MTDGVSTDLASLAERPGELLADHAPAADDDYTHGIPLVLDVALLIKTPFCPSLTPGLASRLIGG
jgi:hypothetical protein